MSEPKRLEAGTILDSKDLAATLGVCQRTLKRMIARHEVPPGVKLGRRTCWDGGRVQAWIDRRAQEAEKQAESELARIRKLGA